MSMLDEALPRLIYLYSKYPLSIPRALHPFVPMKALLDVLPKGLAEAAQVAQLPFAVVENFYLEGEDLGPGSEQELRYLLSSVIFELVENLENPALKLELSGALQRFRQQEELFKERVIDLTQLDSPELNHLRSTVTKWHSGWEPIDMVLDGILPHSLVLVMGRTQVGKTTTLMSILAAIKETEPERSVLFVENEIEASLMLWRYERVLRGIPMRRGDQLICGAVSPADLVDFVQAHPDPNRVVFFDSPDVMTATTATEKRHVLENHYINLVRVRSVSHAVFTTSQARRGDMDLQLDSAAEAWTKAWYADAVVGIQPAGRSPKGLSRLRIKSLKNRWGPGGRSLVYDFNYETCEISHLKEDDEFEHRRKRKGEEDEDEEDTW